MAKTEDERMQNYVHRNGTFGGRIANTVIETARAAIGKPPMWHQLRHWELRQEAAKEQAALRALAVDVKPPTLNVLRPEQVADRLAASMTRGIDTERAARLTPSREAPARAVGGR